MVINTGLLVLLLDVDTVRIWRRYLVLGTRSVMLVSKMLALTFLVVESFSVFMLTPSLSMYFLSAFRKI